MSRCREASLALNTSEICPIIEAELLLSLFKTFHIPGEPGWLRLLIIQLRSGHDPMAREFEPRVRLCADSLVSLSPSLCLPCTHIVCVYVCVCVCVCVCLKNKTLKNK